MGDNEAPTKLNPSAASFSFNPSASTWAPPPPAAATTTTTPATPAPPAPTEKAQVVEQITEKIQETTIDKEEEEEAQEDEEESSKDIKKEEETEEDPRQHINLVFIGHVDAGKSTLSGNILYLMDMVDARTIERYEKEAKDRNRDSWFLAFIMDTGEEERAKGKTVEVGRACFETPERRFTMLDAPGHKNYVPNMIQGASQADVAVLVISARKGEFETGFEKGGQTREHAMLAKTLGVDKLVVVINKMDEAKWAESRYNECVSKLGPFLKSCGYAVKKNVTFVPISGLTGENVKKPLIACDWYKDKRSLIDILNSIEISGRNPNGPLRVPVLDRYQERGTITMGKVESGLLRTGSKLMIMPTGVPVTASQVYINDVAVKTAKPGENVKVKLSANHMDDVQKGFVLCESGGDAPISNVKKFVAQIALVDMLDHRPLFTAGYNAILHVHSLAEECVVTRIRYKMEKSTGQKKKATFVKQGEVVVCDIEVEKSICVDTFDNMPQMGRFTLRDEGKSIGIGKILKLLPTV